MKCCASSYFPFTHLSEKALLISLSVLAFLSCHRDGLSEDRSGSEWIMLSGTWEVEVPGQDRVTLSLPGNLYRHPVFAGSRPAHFRLWRQVTIPQGMSGLGLRTGILSDGDRTYFNGKLIGKNDAAAGGPVAYDRSRIYPIPDSVLRPGTNVIMMEVDAFFPHEAGLLGGAPAIAPLPQLYQDLMLEEGKKLFPIGLLVMAGLYFGLLHLRHQRDRSSLWLSLFFLILSAYLAHRSSLKYMSGIDLLSLKRLEYIALLLVALPLMEFFHMALPYPLSFHRIRVPLRLLVQGTLLILAGSAIWICFSADLLKWDAFNVNVVQRLLWPILLAETSLRLFAGLLRFERVALVLSATSLVSLLGAVIDVLIHQGLWTAAPLAHLTFLAFPFGLTVIQIDRIVRMQHDLETLNHTLEEKVKDRTAALTTSLEEVRSLKDQQDGDYFLTSLLLKPLSTTGHMQLPGIDVAFFCQQKKRFPFRNKSVELGGDLNIATTLKLSGRSYLAILNGDAMGKSIQGAGGALVIGTVFRSFLAGTNRFVGSESLSPEEWLAACYLELQNVFRSFEGSMMASAIIALMDEENGCFYHLNAEHPRIVLCREGKPSFLCSTAELRRFGFAEPGNPRVQVSPLLPGDVLLMGTDGRDDLLLPAEAPNPGTRMNDDPARFLRIASTAESDAGSHTGSGSSRLDTLVRELIHTGDLSDDLALIRIEWHGPPAHHTVPHPGRRVRDLLQRGDLHASLALLDQYIEQNPADAAGLRAGVKVAERLGHPCATRWRSRLDLRLSA